MFAIVKSTFAAAIVIVHHSRIAGDNKGRWIKTKPSKLINMVEEDYRPLSDWPTLDYTSWLVGCF